MRLNRKWILVIALVLSMATAISGTLAYLTSTDTATNTFTVGNVSIDLEEPSYTGNNQTLLPGVEIAKDPQIKNTGSSEAWVWMEITVPTDLMSYIDWNTTDWTKTETTSGTNTIVTLKRESKLPAGETTAKAFTKVALPASLTSMPENLGTGTVDIVVNAFAIQDANFANVDAAIAAYDGEGGDPSTPEANRGDNDGVTYTLPEGTTYTEVSTSEELVAALNAKDAVILLKNGEYNWSGTGHIGTAQSVTIYGESKSAVLKVTNEGVEGGDNDFDGYTVIFNNLTITSDNDWTTGWKRMNATFNDCVINNNYNLVNGNHVFNYCTLNQTADQYNIWTYGASNAEFNYCTFNCAGKSIYVDGNGSNKTVLKVNNCIFNDNGGVENKAAIETGTTYGTTYDLIVNNTAVNGFAVNPNGTSTGSTLWANKHSMAADKLNVVVDGVEVY